MAVLYYFFVGFTCFPKWAIANYFGDDIDSFRSTRFGEIQ